MPSYNDLYPWLKSVTFRIESRLQKIAMIPLLIIMLLSVAAHADHSPSFELFWTNYDRREVGNDRQYRVALDRFQWRLSEQWKSKSNTLKVALTYDRIHVNKDYEGHGLLFGLPIETLYQLPLEINWKHRWTPNWSTITFAIPAIIGEEESNTNRYPLWGGFLLVRNGIGVGIARLEVSGRLRWWPAASIYKQWRNVRIDGLFPRHLNVSWGPANFRAALEGAQYKISYTSPSREESLQPLYFSQLHVGAGLVFAGPYRLAMAFEGGRVIRRRFEGPVIEARDRDIDAGWYRRATIRWGGTRLRY